MTARHTSHAGGSGTRRACLPALCTYHPCHACPPARACTCARVRIARQAAVGKATAHSAGLFYATPICPCIRQPTQAWRFTKGCRATPMRTCTPIPGLVAHEVAVVKARGAWRGQLHRRAVPGAASPQEAHVGHPAVLEGGDQEGRVGQGRIGLFVCLFVYTYISSITVGGRGSRELWQHSMNALAALLESSSAAAAL